MHLAGTSWVYVHDSGQVDAGGSERAVLMRVLVRIIGKPAAALRRSSSTPQQKKLAVKEYVSELGESSPFKSA